MIIFHYFYNLNISSMKIALLTVGKTDRDWVKQGLDIYVSRLKHYIPFSINEIPELKNVSAMSRDQIKTKEGELIFGSTIYVSLDTLWGRYIVEKNSPLIACTTAEDFCNALEFIPS